MELSLDPAWVYVPEEGGSPPVLVVPGADGKVRSFVEGEDRGRIYAPGPDDALMEWRVRSVDRGEGYVFYMVSNPLDPDHGASIKIQGDLLTFLGVDYHRELTPPWVSLTVTPFES